MVKNPVTEDIAFAVAPVKEVKPSITFNIGIPHAESLEYIYIIGDIQELGAWLPENAVKVKRTKRGAFNKTVKLPVGTEFQFKILSDTEWKGVEKGQYYEELPNRYAKVSDIKNKKIVEVKEFANI